jgi:Transcriptional regulators
MGGMREIAKITGVALSTVSLALNGNGYVSQEISEKVKEAAKQIDYIMPEKKNKNTIAVILPVITSSFYSNVLCGIENTIAEKGYTVIFGNSGFDFEKEFNFIKTVKRQTLSGIIITSVCPAERECEYFKLLKKDFTDKGVSVVFLESHIESDDFFSINIDCYKSAFIATEYLIEQNHKCIAHISGHIETKTTLQRINGYRDALESHNIPYDEELIVNGDYSPNSGYMAIKKLMNKRSDFTALYAANDQMAIGAIKAIKSFGKSVPDDIVVIGNDNIAASSLISPALSTVNIPTYQMGHMAAKIILDAQQKILCEKSYTLECNLIIRQSTSLYANSEWELFGW